MRFFIGLLLVAGFLAAGVAGLIGFARVYAAEGLSEDAGAALFIGGMLTLIGLLMLYGVIKTRRRQRAIDTDQATAMGMAHWMTMDHSGDGGDVGGD